MWQTERGEALPVEANMGSHTQGQGESRKPLSGMTLQPSVQFVDPLDPAETVMRAGGPAVAASARTHSAPLRTRGELEKQDKQGSQTTLTGLRN